MPSVGEAIAAGARSESDVWAAALRGAPDWEPVFSVLVPEPLDDLRGRLPFGELVEELLDVRDFKGALLQGVFPDQVVGFAHRRIGWTAARPR